MQAPRRRRSRREDVRRYGPIDRDRERDITTATGQSKGRKNNPGDYGNGNDGRAGTGAQAENRAATNRRRRLDAQRTLPRRSGRSYPYPG